MVSYKLQRYTARKIHIFNTAMEVEGSDDFPEFIWVILAEPFAVHWNRGVLTYLEPKWSLFSKNFGPFRLQPHKIEDIHREKCLDLPDLYVKVCAELYRENPGKCG